MARRGVPEINAGSMADIAFLLLVFFLMVTTIESEEGIFRILPPPIEDDTEEVDVRDRDVFVVKVNMNNQLLVENEYIQLNDLKEQAKTFMISNGVFSDLPQDPNMPIKSWIRRDSINNEIETTKAIIAGFDDETDEATRDAAEAKLSKWQIKKKVYEEFGRYKPFPGQAIISMQNDNGTNYETYIGVQSELTAAVGELRDELSIEKFGRSYTELEKEYDRQKNDEDVNDELKDKVLMIREVYPLKIVEAEPANVEKY